MLKTLIRTLIAVALVLASLQLVYWSAVRRHVQAIAGAAEPFATLSYGSIDLFPPGELAVRDVRLVVKGREHLHLDADRIRLHQLDPLWLIGTLAGIDHGPASRVSVQIDGLRPSPALLRALRQRAGALGVVLPFESVGCAQGDTFDDADYTTLHWDAPRLDVQLHWQRQLDQRRVDAGLRIDRHPAGVMQTQLRFVDVSERASILSPGMGGARLDQATIRYDNTQALTERNALCAERLDDGQSFAVEHMRQVHDLLRGMGVVPDEPIWAAYRSWLEQGGTLNLVAEPAPGVPFTEYAAFAPEDRLRLLGLTAQIAESAPVPVEAIAARTSAIEFRPLPDDAIASEPAPGTVTDAEPDAFPVEAPGAAPVSAPAAAPMANGAVQAPTAASRRPVLVVTPIEFGDLPTHVGERVRVATLGGSRHVGVVLGSTDDAVELQISRYGGAARLPIAQVQIQRIELLREEIPSP